MITIMDGRFFLVIAAVFLLSFSKQQFFQLTKQPALAVAPAHTKPTQSRHHSRSPATPAPLALARKNNQTTAETGEHATSDELVNLQKQFAKQQEQLATLTSDLRTLKKTWAFEDWEFKHWWEQLTHVSTQATFIIKINMSRSVNEV